MCVMNMSQKASFSTCAACASKGSEEILLPTGTLNLCEKHQEELYKWLLKKEDNDSYFRIVKLETNFNYLHKTLRLIQDKLRETAFISDKLVSHLDTTLYVICPYPYPKEEEE